MVKNKTRGKFKVVINGKTSWLTENQYQYFLNGTTPRKPTLIIIDSSGPCFGIGSSPSKKLNISRKIHNV